MSLPCFQLNWRCDDLREMFEGDTSGGFKRALSGLPCAGGDKAEEEAGDPERKPPQKGSNTKVENCEAGEGAGE